MAGDRMRRRNNPVNRRTIRNARYTAQRYVNRRTHAVGQDDDRIVHGSWYSRGGDRWHVSYIREMCVRGADRNNAFGAALAHIETGSALDFEAIYADVVAKGSAGRRRTDLKHCRPVRRLEGYVADRQVIVDLFGRFTGRDNSYGVKIA